MEFLSAIISTVIKMVIVGAFSFGGIMFGKKLREKKNSKQ